MNELEWKWSTVCKAETSHYAERCMELAHVQRELAQEAEADEENGFAE